jgi:nucleoside-diphosphate-sugar epimerase
MERAFRKGATRTGVDVACLRLSNVYGWGDRGIVDALVPQIRSGEELVLPGKGWVNTIHVADVVSAARQLANASGIAESRGVGPEGRFIPFICTDDRAHRVDRLVETVAQVLGVRPPTLRSPGLIGPKGQWSERDRSVRLVERNRYSNSKLKALLEDWPSWPILDKGLASELEPIDF